MIGSESAGPPQVDMIATLYFEASSVLDDHDLDLISSPLEGKVRVGVAVR